jgi:Mrp family chromosome partitioning ATPase
VIIDSPPLLTISHATVLTASSDAILVVARAENLRADVANDLKTALDALSTPKLGVVLTAADAIHAYGYYAPTFGSFQRAKTADGGRGARATAAPHDPAAGLLRSEDDVGRIHHAT